MYDGQEYVYTFHADAPAKMLLLGSNLGKKRKSAQISGQQPMVFASVIGGLSGINLLAEAWLPDPDEIILYDMNPWILEYARLVVELIGTSTSREDYISRLFSRRLSDFLATKNVTELSPETEHAFLDLSIDTALTQQTSEALTNTSRCVFAWVTHTLMKQPHRSTPPPAPRRVCERVQLFHDPNRAPKLDVGLVHSGKCLAHVSAHQCKQRINTCTLYLGHGWLRSESTFSRVRARLNAARVRYVQWNVMQPLDQLYAAGAGDQPADTVLYTSNINAFLKKGLWSQTLASWRSQIASWRGASLFVAALNEDVTAITSPRAPADASASLVATSPLLSTGRSGKRRAAASEPVWAWPRRTTQSMAETPGVVRPAMEPHCHLVRCSGAHKCAWQAIAHFLYFNQTRRVAEITRQVPWGFNEFGGMRSNVAVTAFNASKHEQDIILFHILVGEGVSRLGLQSALRAAAGAGVAQIWVVEHNRESTSFLNRSSWAAAASKGKPREPGSEMYSFSELREDIMAHTHMCRGGSNRLIDACTFSATHGGGKHDYRNMIVGVRCNERGL